MFCYFASKLSFFGVILLEVYSYQIQVVVGLECPTGTGWSEFSSTCYYVQGGSMVWDTAVATCEGQGASIVEITSIEENNYINSISNGWHIWLNCRDHLVEGQFVCGDDDHPITYTANELSSNTEQADCVYSIAGTWGVYDCAATPISIVCEIDDTNSQEPSSATVETAECPTGTGWSEFSSTCYYVQGGSMDWDTAVATCEGQGASIVEITSTEENNYVNSISNGWFIWLNCRDHLAEGQFVCGDDGHPIGYTANEISSSNTDVADCVSFIAGIWGVHSCLTPMSIVCELDDTNSQEPSSATVETAECPTGTGWSEFSSTCYYVQGGSMDWDTAVATCEGQGASIVEITSTEENNYVNSISNGWHIWLNCRDHLVEGQFVCGDDDHPITYTANELSLNTEQADCVYSIAGTWGVYDCAVTPISIVCEIDDTNPQELSSATVETAECPTGTGWSEFSSTCYYVQGGSMVWDTAVATCEGQGASIVEITSIEENNYVNSISNGWFIWLNCRDHLVEGQFVCGDDDHPITYTANEILSSNTDQADCVYFIAGTWGVYDCAATPISIVCEIGVANPQETSPTVVTTEQPIFSSAESVESTTEEHVSSTAEVTTDQTIPSENAVITTDMPVYPTAVPKSQMRGLNFGYMKIYSISTGNCLVGHVIHDVLLSSKIRCVARCLSLPDCLSINVFSREGRVQCQLNNSNRTVSSSDFLMVDDCQYFEYIMHS